MNIKTKLTLGVGLLFLLIIVQGAVSVGYINALKADSENILADNYITLLYTGHMLKALEEPDQKSTSFFEKNLAEQEQNITEIGEKEATQEVRAYFEQFKVQPTDSAVGSALRKAIFNVTDINMQAIQRKSEISKSTSESAVFWIAVAATFCFLIAFTLLVNLPANVAGPIEELTNSIRQIAEKNYSERVHFEQHNEFGQLARSFNSMAQKLEEYNNSSLARLMMEKKRIEVLINNMRDPVIGLDENLRIIFANEESTKISGLAHDQLIGQPATTLALKNDLIRALVHDIADAPSVADVAQTPIKIYADNREGYFEKEILHLSIVPTGERESRLIGHVILLKNITAYKELDFAKTNFIATVSHEFKTPISSIKMSVQLLENKQIGTLNPEQINLLDSIKEDANRLLKITGELLDMTQLETGNIQLNLVPTAPQELVQYALNATKMQAEQKNIRLRVHYADNLPPAQADAEKTAWVLTNLIANAIHYSHDNTPIEIEVRPSGQHVLFTIKDAGQGIAPQYKDKIFDRYFRVPGSKKDGTGLGLSISKEFIEAQGGTIHVDSELGAGSTFTVALNRAGE